MAASSSSASPLLPFMADGACGDAPSVHPGPRRHAAFEEDYDNPGCETGGWEQDAIVHEASPASSSALATQSCSAELSAALRAAAPKQSSSEAPAAAAVKRRRLSGKVSVSTLAGAGTSDQCSATPASASSARLPPADEAHGTAETFPRSVHKKAWLRMRDLYVQDFVAAIRGDEAVSSRESWASARDAARAAFRDIDAHERCSVAERAASAARSAAEPCPQLIRCLESKAVPSTRGAGYVVNLRQTMLLTYNGPWGLVPGITPSDVGPVVGDGVRQLADFLAQHKTVKSLWAEFRTAVLSFVDDLSCSRWSACFEVCPTSLQPGNPVRVHAHVFLETSGQFRLRTFHCVSFRGCAPHRSKERILHLEGRGRAAFTAANAGHYYVRAPKTSSIVSAGSHEPYLHFPVRAEWVTAYWQGGKLTDQAAIAEYVRVKRDVQRNVANVRSQARMAAELSAVATKQAVQHVLCSSKAPRIALPQVDRDFLGQFEEGCILHRRRFLVLEGPSGCGKTEFARALANTGSEVYEMNCAHTLHPDLRGYDSQQHHVLLFDEGTADMVINNKKLFQAPAVDIQLGSSATNVHSFTVWVYGKKLVVCSNTWSRELDQMAHEDVRWLQANSVHVRVTGPLWSAK